MKVLHIGHAGAGLAVHALTHLAAHINAPEAQKANPFDSTPTFPIINPRPILEKNPCYGYPISGKEARRIRRKQARSKN